MSDNYQYLFFPELELEEVSAAKENVLNCLWDAGIVQTKNEPELSLGERLTYGPDDRLRQLCHEPDRLPFEMSVRGMEVVSGFGFMGWELNQIEHLICAKCGEKASLEQANIIALVESFHKTGRIPANSCPFCQVEKHPAEWKSEPALTFTYLGFAFWSWPPFKKIMEHDDDFWKIDIPSLMQEAAQSPIAFSFGRV